VFLNADAAQRKQVLKQVANPPSKLALCICVQDGVWRTQMQGIVFIHPDAWTEIFESTINH
jgi:hypothetical protein